MRDRLAGLRSRIDALDDRVLDLLNARARLVVQVYAHKLKNAGKAPVLTLVPGREAEILRRLAERNSGPFPARGIRPVFREIISACRSLEGKGPPKVAYAGSKGSPVEKAALESFGAGARLLACRNVDEVFEKLSGGDVAYGVVPKPAARGPRVDRAFERLADSGFTVCAEVDLGGMRGGACFAVVGNCVSRPTDRDKTAALVELRGRASSAVALDRLFVRRRIVPGVLVRLSGAPPGATRYFLEFEGHQSAAPVRRLLSELSSLAASLKVLGSYPAA